VLAAKGRRHGIVTRLDDADALRPDPIVSRHNPGGCFTRDDDARGGSEGGPLSVAESVSLRNV
jgi:hypothetical protein